MGGEGRGMGESQKDDEMSELCSRRGNDHGGGREAEGVKTEHLRPPESDILSCAV